MKLKSILIVVLLISLKSTAISQKEQTDFDKWSQFWIANATEEIFTPQNMEIGITNKKRELARQVFNFLTPVFSEFLNIAQCEPNSAGITPEVKEAFCINRILKVEDFSISHGDVTPQIHEIIEETFYLGIFTHLYLWNFPSRGNSQNVDKTLLSEKWQIDAIAADYVIGYYGDPNNPVMMNLWEYYYYTYTSPVLESYLTLTPFQEGQFKSYFRNLYLSGALLAMDYDLATKGE